MLGIANLLYYAFLLWLCTVVPPLGILLLIAALHRDLKG